MGTRKIFLALTVTAPFAASPAFAHGGFDIAPLKPVVNWLGEFFASIGMKLSGLDVSADFLPYLLLGVLLAFAFIGVVTIILYTKKQPEMEGIDEDRADFNYCRSKAERGDVEAQYELAQRYLKGKGTPPNADDARIWLERAAVQGHEQAQKALSA